MWLIKTQLPVGEAILLAGGAAGRAGGCGLIDRSPRRGSHMKYMFFLSRFSLFAVWSAGYNSGWFLDFSHHGRYVFLGVTNEGGGI